MFISSIKKNRKKVARSTSRRYLLTSSSRYRISRQTRTRACSQKCFHFIWLLVPYEFYKSRLPPDYVSICLTYFSTRFLKVCGRKLSMHGSTPGFMESALNTTWKPDAVFSIRYAVSSGDGTPLEPGLCKGTPPASNNNKSCLISHFTHLSVTSFL